jgi:hypothetical protein
MNVDPPGKSGPPGRSSPRMPGSCWWERHGMALGPGAPISYRSIDTVALAALALGAQAR